VFLKISGIYLPGYVALKSRKLIITGVCVVERGSEMSEDKGRSNLSLCSTTTS